MPEIAATPRPALRVEVAVVGGGPAGIAAACRAAEAGASTVLLDEGVNLGGQIDRHRPGGPIPQAARPWLERLARSGVRVLGQASCFDAQASSEGFTLLADREGARLEVQASRLVLATGARELFLPFPGWTLPNVLGVGGAQALLKSGAEMRGKRVVIAGSGPLLLPVAAAFAKAGAEVVLVAEQARRRDLARFAVATLGQPGKLWEGIRYRAAFGGTPYLPSTWVKEARGRASGDRVGSVVLTDGNTDFEVGCDLLATGFGLVPNVELARHLGCALDAATPRAVRVDGRQETRVPGIFAAGEVCGVAGADTARAEGEIAGLAAAGAWNAASPEGAALEGARTRGRKLATALDLAFRPRAELRHLATPETLVCRCEDVPLGRIDPAWTPRQAKLYTRAGMGPCQGRVCGPALSFLFGWREDSVRSPLQPTTLGNLLSPEDR